MINAKSQCTPMLNSHNLARSTMMLSINMKYVLLVMVNVTSITSIDIRTYTQEVIHFSFSQLFVSFVCDFLSLRSRSFFPFVSCIYYFLNMLRHCNAYALFYVLVVGTYFFNSRKLSMCMLQFRIFYLTYLNSVKLPNIQRGMLP